MAASTDFDYTIKLSLEKAKLVRRSWKNFLNGRELVIEYQDISPAQKEESIEWLQDNRASVANPYIGFKTFDGTWLSTDVAYIEDRNVIRQSFTGAKQSAPITVGSTKWRVRQASNYRGSNNTVVLELLNVDPAYANEVMNANTEQFYTNSIYTEDDGVLAGTWYNIDTRLEKSETTGMLNVLWTVSQQANDDVHFSWQRSENAIAAQFFKFDAAETGIESLKTQYYFDPNGDWYISTDGTYYTEKNGTATPLAFTVAGTGSVIFDGVYELTAGTGPRGDPTSRWTKAGNGANFFPDAPDKWALYYQSALVASVSATDGEYPWDVSWDTPFRAIGIYTRECHPIYSDPRYHKLAIRTEVKLHYFEARLERVRCRCPPSLLFS